MLPRPPHTLFRVLCILARLLRKVIAYPKVAIRLLQCFLSRYQPLTRGEPTYGEPTTTLSPACCGASLSEDLSLLERGDGGSTSPPSGASCAVIDAIPASQALQGDPPTLEPDPMGSANPTQADGSRSSGNRQPSNATNGWTWMPVTATDVMGQRYDQNRFATESPSLLKIDAGRIEFEDDNKSGWTNCVHPEGALYFSQEWPAEDGTVLKIFTNVDVRELNLDIRPFLDQATTGDLVKHIKGGLSNVDELVLCPDTKTKTMGYYFVNRNARCLVWAKTLATVALQASRLTGPMEPTVKALTDNVKGIRNMGHIKHAMESQYWVHIEAFPHARTLEAEMYRELSNVVLHACADRLTSPTSLSPYGADELAKIKDIIDSLKDQLGTKTPHAVCVIARISHTFAASRLHNFCGQPEARMDADKSVRCRSHSSHPVFSCLSLCMFFTPHSQLERLRTIWVDRTVNAARWKEYISAVYDEFTGLTLYSTVMLAVDVSLLAVPFVEGTTSLGNEDGATVCTYISIIAVVGSMTLSLLLSTDARRRQSQSAPETASILDAVSSLFGLEILAVMYSLPFSLLMWGCVAFSLASIYKLW